MMARPGPAIKSFWYWFFGGSNVDHHPSFKVSNWTESIAAWFRGGEEMNVAAGAGAHQN